MSKSFKEHPPTALSNKHRGKPLPISLLQEALEIPVTGGFQAKSVFPCSSLPSLSTHLTSGPTPPQCTTTVQRSRIPLHPRDACKHLAPHTPQPSRLSRREGCSLGDAAAALPAPGARWGEPGRDVPGGEEGTARTHRPQCSLSVPALHVSTQCGLSRAALTALAVPSLSPQCPLSLSRPAAAPSPAPPGAPAAAPRMRGPPRPGEAPPARPSPA